MLLGVNILHAHFILKYDLFGFLILSNVKLAKIPAKERFCSAVEFLSSVKFLKEWNDFSPAVPIIFTKSTVTK